MITLIWETLYIGAFVFAISYCLHYIAYKKGIDATDTEKAKKTGISLLDKWLEFGGGYYGSVALLTLMFIELGQLKSFIQNWPGAQRFISELGVGTLIGFVIDQLMSFYKAAVWPFDYLGRYSIWHFVIFILLTYLAYDRARFLAKRGVLVAKDD